MRALMMVVLVASLSACATGATRPDPVPHAPLRANNTIVGIETITLYSATASTGQNLVPGFANHPFAMCYAQSGTFWVKRHTPDETPASVTNPTPSANATAAGWTRLLAGTTQVWGVEGRAATANEQTYFVSVWAEGGGDLICVWH